jgi:hypothetical protein
MYNLISARDFVSIFITNDIREYKIFEVGNYLLHEIQTTDNFAVDEEIWLYHVAWLAWPSSNKHSSTN